MTAIQCGFNFFELIKTVMGINCFLGGSHVQSSLLPQFALLFCSCTHSWVSGRGVTTSSLSCSSSWTTRSWRSFARIGSTCSTGTPSSRSPRCARRSGRSWEQAGIVTSTCKTHRSTFAFLGFSPSRSVCHGPLRQEAPFRTCLALFRDILLFCGGHFGSEVSCGSSIASASWASLRGGELVHKIHSHGFCLSLRSSTCRRLRRLHARCRTWSAASHCAWCTALDRVDFSQKQKPFAYHITLCSLLSHVSVVPCVFVLCVLPRLPDSDKKVSFFAMASKSVDTR